MNRLYILKSGSREIRGLVSPGELPDVVINFYHEAERRGAKAEYLHGGILKASKGKVKVTLEIKSFDGTIPSKSLSSSLDKMMDWAFHCWPE